MGILDEFKLDGRVAVVTGAGRGIGRGIAIGLAEAGCDVVVTARRTHEIEAVAHEIQHLGRRAIAVPGDIRLPETSRAVAAAAVEAFGKLDIWVNNAGGAEDRTMRQLAVTPDDAWADQIGLNLDATFFGARAALEHLGSGGSIINITSMVAGRPSANNGPYAAAKAAAVQLTTTLAAEQAARGIRVNCVSPGPVPTEVFMEALHLTEAALPAVAAMVPLGRLGTPEDVAAAVVYLCSPAAAWVTGHNLVVTGGMS